MRHFAAFLSYARLDDDNNNGAITRLRSLISSEVHVQTGSHFEIFQDRENIDWGVSWKKRIDEALDSTSFLLPVITPSFCASGPCRQELIRFAQRERELSRDDLILPIYLVNCPSLGDPEARAADEVLALIAARQWFDFRDLRLKLRLDQNSELLLERVELLAQQICLATTRAGSISRATKPSSQRDERTLSGYKHISPGSFTMGTGEIEARQRERPPRSVHISKGYLMSAHPVTVASFRRFVEATGYRTHAERKRKGTVRIWNDPGILQDDQHPVVCVSWYDAEEYCKWLSDMEGRRFRLPREAEWEHACRAASRTKWFCGDDPAYLEHYAWYVANSKGATQRVGVKNPNLHGLLDMHGNVWEWCQDWYSRYSQNSGELIDPAGPESGIYKVARGGSWRDSAAHTHSSFRIRLKPSHHANNIGFRLITEI